MTNKTTVYILAWIFLIASFVYNYDVNVICASIFFSTYYVIETIENGGKKE